MEGTLRETFVKTLGAVWSNIVSFLPNLLTMVVVIVLGIVLGGLVRILLHRALQAIAFDRVSERMGLTSLIARGGMQRSPSETLGILAGWVVILVFLMAGLGALDLPASRALVADFYLYLPRLLTALVILVVGLLASGFLERAVLIAAVNARLPHAGLLGRLTRLLLLFFFFGMAFEQLGIGKEIIVTTFAVVVGGIVLALALAFGLGAQGLAREALEQYFKKGEKKEENEKEDQISHL